MALESIPSTVDKYKDKTVNKIPPSFDPLENRVNVILSREANVVTENTVII